MRTFKYLFIRLYGTLLLFREGYRFRDKVILFPNGLLQALVGLMRICRLPEWTHKVADLPVDVMIENKQGLFYCRKRTNDHRILCRAYEPFVTNYLRPMKQGVFVDIGAHVGRYSVMVAGRWGTEARSSRWSRTRRTLPP